MIGIAYRAFTQQFVRLRHHCAWRLSPPAALTKQNSQQIMQEQGNEAVTDSGVQLLVGQRRMPLCPLYLTLGLRDQAVTATAATTAVRKRRWRKRRK